MKMNFEVPPKAKRLRELKVHQDGLRMANFLEWWSAVASVREANVNLRVQLKERFGNDKM